MPFVVLRFLGVERYTPAREIYLIPSQIQKFANPRAGIESDHKQRTQRLLRFRKTT
jgi:hypothetical protein